MDHVIQTLSLILLAVEKVAQGIAGLVHLIVFSVLWIIRAVVSIVWWLIGMVFWVVYGLIFGFTIIPRPKKIGPFWIV